MSRLQAALGDIASYLQREHRGFALVGGLAVSAHAEPRFTRDIDLAVATTDDPDTEALVRGLIAAGYGVRATLEQEAVGRLATVRLETPGEGPSAVVVDLDVFVRASVSAATTGPTVSASSRREGLRCA